ncbi:MAG: ATP synthase F1 subunit gamma [Dissulfurimicrobium sp.]|uniref:ATP synthase F1 subunit gamma n=1 Tax=Dissulfurimicrobium TaxID=1769732 RepID=UPI003C725C56
MPSLKDVKIKINGVKKTQQITKAMNMVAAAKLRGAQKRMEDFRPYAEKFTTVISELSGSANPNAFPLMAFRPVKKVLLLVVTSDRGLCGPFNSNLINAAEKFAKNQKNEGRDVALACIGRKGVNYFSKSQYDLLYKSVDVMSNVQMLNARQTGKEVMNLFLEQMVDEVQLLYGKFVNVVVQRPYFKRLLPISQKGLEDIEAQGNKTAVTYTYEPEPEQILNQLLPMYINVQIMHAMLETAASEQAARMTSMDNATRACKDMITSLTLIYNKARQSSITKELMDIVGGAEALKG